MERIWRVVVGVQERSCIALVADVGRLTVRVGLTNDLGVLRHETVRSYEPAAQPTVAGAISTFAREQGLTALPHRLGVAVSGMTRGDTVSVTNGRWRVSKSGLAAMIRGEPLIINDFAAYGWALSADTLTAQLDALANGGVRPRESGTYCIIGLGSGLGVTVLSRDAHGVVNVLATEAGHSAFPSGMPELDAVIQAMGARHGFATSEMLISSAGLVAIYTAVAKRRGQAAATAEAKDIIRLGLSARNPIAVESLSLFVRALWHLAGNMVLTFGAWDGVILTGSLTAALGPLLKQPDLARQFVLSGPYGRDLTAVPRSSLSCRYAELEGAAAALLVEDTRRAFGQRAIAA